MDLTVNKFDQAKPIKEGLKAYRMHSSENLEIVHLHLLAEEMIEVHINHMDVVFCIIDGSAEMSVDGSVISAARYDVISVPAGVERGMKNKGNSDLRVLVIKKIA